MNYILIDLERITIFDLWEAAKMTDPAIIEAGSDQRIKRLMEQVGMPNSRSLYQAFKQIELELELEYASREAAALERAAQIADDRPDSIMKGEAREIAATIRALIPKDSGGP